MTGTQPNDVEALGKRLNQFRRLVEKSPEEFATDLLITVTDLEEIERGAREADLSSLNLPFPCLCRSPDGWVILVPNFYGNIIYTSSSKKM